MTENRFNRRQFGRSLGVALAWGSIPSALSQGVAGGRLKGVLPSDPILINSNENPYGPSPRALEAITGSEAVACRYPDASYSRAVSAIAESHGVSADCVALGCGSTEILRVADAAFLGAGKNLVIAEPTFEAVTYYAEVSKAEVVKVPLTADFRHDLPKMAAACTTATGLIYVCNPNNPTATIVTRDEMADFMSRVPPSIYVLVDEAYFHFVEDPRYASVIEWTRKYQNLVVARTFSKVYGMAGLRIGYAVAQKETIGKMRPQVLFDNGNAAALAAAVTSLDDPEVVPLNKKRLNETRRRVTAELRKNGHRVIHSEANFFMVEVGADVAPVIEAFSKRGIMVGRKFPSMGTWLRVSVGKPDEMREFLAAFREIASTGAAAAA